MDVYQVLAKCGMKVSFEPVMPEVPTWDGTTLHVCHWHLTWLKEWHGLPLSEGETDLGAEDLYSCYKGQLGVWSLIHELGHLLVAKFPNASNYGNEYDSETHVENRNPLLSKDDGDIEEWLTQLVSYAIGYWFGRSDESIQEELMSDPDRPEHLWQVLQSQDNRDRLAEAWELFLLLVEG